MNWNQLRKKLRAPLPPDAITPNVATGLSSIKPAYVTERLNDCFGENGWTAKYEIIERGEMIVVRCDLVVPKWKIKRQAFGGNSNSDRGDAFKGACTDALTKCASHLGIGAAVYKGLHNADPHAKNGDAISFPPPRLNGDHYGIVDGVVRQYKPLSRNAVFLMVGETKVRATGKETIRQLKNCRGKHVELRCRKERVGDTTMATVLNVLAMRGAQA